MSFCIDKVEEMLKTLTTQQIADRLDITRDSVLYRLKMAGTDARQIKDDYAIEIITNLMCSNTCKQMALITGFSLRKVKIYTSRINEQM